MASRDQKRVFNVFLRRTTLIAAVLLITDMLLKFWFPELPHSEVRPWLIVFFLLTTNLVFYLQLKAITAKETRFVNTFLVSTGFKLLFFLAIILVYALLVRNDAVLFIIDFFILYLIFTVLEVLNISKIQHRLRKE